MKKNLSFLLGSLLALPVMGQSVNVGVGNVTYAFSATEMGEAAYSDNGTKLTVQGMTFNVDDITEIDLVNTAVDDGTVQVTYGTSAAQLLVAGNVAPYLTIATDGAHVSITQSDLVADDTCGEITYSLSGSSADGEFALTGSYKASIELNGLTLTNPSGAALNIQDGKRISLSVKKNTENTLTDCASGEQKGCIACKGHLELKGKGTLNVYGNTLHGIYAKEYVTVKNLTLNVLAAAKDGINCNQYFAMESGTVTCSGLGDDGVQVSYKDDTDRDAEDTGSLSITGGTLNIATTAKASKGITAEGNVDITGGEITIACSGNGTWDSDNSKTKACAGISSDANVTIGGGTLSLTSTGAGGKGISCDGELNISGGSTTVSTTGGLYAYVNGTEYTNYTGNTDNLSTSYKSSPKGMRAEGNVNISGGTVNVTTTGNGAEGIESKAVMTITDGTIVVNAYDDALNSSSHMYIKGGDITAVASNNDGLDSNGNMYISGGVIRAFGTSSPECGIDANEEDNYSVIFTGGTLLAVGGGNSVPSTSESTQPYVSGSASVTANTEITLKSGDTTLATFTVPSTYSSSSSSQGGGPGGRAGGGPGGGGGGGSWGGGGSCSVLVSCAGLTSGSSYTLTSGSSSSSVTAKLTGSSSSGGGGGWH